MGNVTFEGGGERIHVTLLKLHLYLQVALQQIKNHRFHVTTDSTAVSEQKTSQMQQQMQYYYHSCMLEMLQRLNSGMTQMFKTAFCLLAC